MLETSLIPYKEHTIDFYNDKIPTVKVNEEDVYAPVKPMCNNIGIKRFDYQYEKIR